MAENNDELNIKFSSPTPKSQSVPDDVSEVFVTDESLRVIPQDANENDDKLFKQLHDDAIKTQYSLINTGAIALLVLTIALTLALMRTIERYDTEKNELTFQSFFDGSYTEKLSQNYLKNMNLSDMFEKSNAFFCRLYGIDNYDDTDVVNNPVENIIGHTTTTAYLPDVDKSVTSISTNVTSVSNSSITAETSPILSEGSSASGTVGGATRPVTTSSLTTSLTTTKAFVFSVPEGTTIPSTTSPVVTSPPEVSHSDTSPSETSSVTEPPVTTVEIESTTVE